MNETLSSAVSNFFTKQECDFPDDMRLPGIRPESQQQEINVMEFLNIKRVDAIKNDRNSNQ